MLSLVQGVSPIPLAACDTQSPPIHSHTLVTSLVTSHHSSRLIPQLCTEVDYGSQIVSNFPTCRVSCALRRENNRKALKVPDLKEILKRASVSAPPKANKADLVAKILAEPAAIDAYNALHNPGAATPQQVASSKPKPAAKPPLNPPVSPKKVQVRRVAICHSFTLN